LNVWTFNQTQKNPPQKSLRQKHGACICAKARGFTQTLFLATATSSLRLHLRIGPRIASRAAHCIATSSPHTVQRTAHASHPVQRIGLQLQPDQGAAGHTVDLFFWR